MQFNYEYDTQMRNLLKRWYHPGGTPHAYANNTWGNRAQSCVNDDLRADGLWKGWGFRVSTWNVDSLTGRAGEIVEALMDRKVDVACIQQT